MQAYKRTEHYNQPVRLSDEQRQLPKKVITEFFTTYHLDDFRNIVNEIRQAAITNNCKVFAPGREMNNLLFFLHNLEVLGEAGYLTVKDDLPDTFITPYEQQHCS